MSWKIWNNKDINVIIDFLSINEWKHVQPLSLFFKNGYSISPTKTDLIVFLKIINNRVVSAVFITNKGLIYPIFSSKSKTENDRAILIKLMGSIKLRLHGVVGLAEDVLFFDSVVFNRIKHKNNYTLMKHDYKNDFQLRNNQKIEKATIKDLDKLLPLEIAYQLEEVVINPANLNKRATRVNLKNKLEVSDIYYIEKDGSILSKAGTSHRGKNYVLVGGVFTNPKNREQGYSTSLMNYLIRSQGQKGYQVALFVNSNNIPAINLYKKLNFQYPEPYSIYYYHN